MRVKILRGAPRTWQWWTLRAGAAFLLLFLGVFTFYYLRYAYMIEEKLGGGNRPGHSGLYAAPRVLTAGENITPAEVVAHLDRAGYRAAGSSIGTYRLSGNSLEISSGPDSYFEPHAAVLEFDRDVLARVRSRTRNSLSRTFSLEPLLITNVFDQDREKRRPARFADLPKHVIDAIVSVEDKRFFAHGGLDIFRVAKAAYVDVREQRKEQGASTITMQLARSFWLDREKTWGRKTAEAFLTLELERRFTKQQILELYANEVYLGRRGSFAVHGVGEAARAYFGKDIKDISIDEAATLAGMIQRPSHYNPMRYPERVRERRNLALQLMHENGALGASDYARLIRQPLRLSPEAAASSEAPFFADMVNDQLSDLGDWDFARKAFRVYTTLDSDLQKLAEDAVIRGAASLDKKTVRARKKAAGPPQIAIVVLDPRTGAIKALTGGRSYERSQLNRALAKRQPGSAFKPFVYAAAMQSSLERGNAAVTPATVVQDEPTTFLFNRQEYRPANFGGNYLGGVTLRRALTNSLNIASIKVAEKAGYDNVAGIIRRAGFSTPIHGTPSIALGAYEVTPLELADAYTAFAASGMRMPRYWAQSIRDSANRIVYAHQPKPRRALDPRIAFIMVNMMEDVVHHGTAAGIRASGFTQPAAGKTGTSRDGWFAGFTSELLCIVWTGFDDNAELDLEGSKSALPIWIDFMKNAHKLPAYRNAKPFAAPSGIVRAGIDTSTGLLAGPHCPHVRSEIFVAGSQPKIPCEDPHYDTFQDPYQMGVAAAEGERARRENIFRRIWGVFR